jgi:phosphoribosylanthranilate isomerase
MAEVKFCGITRRSDAEEAVRAGARYVGVIFAGGPRLVDAAGTLEILAGVPRRVGRVGVFGRQPPTEIADLAHAAGVDIVQLHADPVAATVRAVREAFGGPVWAAVRVSGADLPPGTVELFQVADAVVVDARADHALGGTGIVLPWEGLAHSLASVRGQARLSLAGGLTPANVDRAVALLGPDIVDVSSGVETAPGEKDHKLMHAFVGAVRSTTRAA